MLLLCDPPPTPPTPALPPPPPPATTTPTPTLTLTPTPTTTPPPPAAAATTIISTIAILLHDGLCYCSITFTVVTILKNVMIIVIVTFPVLLSIVVSSIIKSSF